MADLDFLAQPDSVLVDQAMEEVSVLAFQVLHVTFIVNVEFRVLLWLVVCLSTLAWHPPLLLSDVFEGLHCFDVLVHPVNLLVLSDQFEYSSNDLLNATLAAQALVESLLCSRFIVLILAVHDGLPQSLDLGHCLLEHSCLSDDLGRDHAFLDQLYQLVELLV